MKRELPKLYDPADIEDGIYQKWLSDKAFAALPDGREQRYVIMMPLPNVTGALHMGHAMDNVMQDLLIRWHRMMGDNTLWLPGTDHAGIATQAVVEKRLFELEGKSRHDVGREGLVERIWAWKDQFESRIVQQQQSMGCSCDWDRARFTMDAVCRRAVRHTFFNLFRDGLIFRGNRLVNWDCQLHTAISDDEIYYETVAGHFWHLRYPIIDPQEGEPTHVVVATTRPETMLGDTAVAVHPDPRGRLETLIVDAREKLESAPAKEREGIEAQIERLEGRRQTHLPELEKLVAMAEAGRKVRLPLLDREMPLILDEWAKPELGSGCVKITPGHDPNDYEVWTRHRDEIGMVNILTDDGTLSAQAGPYAGADRYAARTRVVADLEAQGLMERIEDREVEIGHSDRSKTAIEPYISKQWFLRTGDVEGGVAFGRGTEKEFRAPGLAQAAMDAAGGEWQSATGRSLAFHPDPQRYANTYTSWLAEKRDWCISRQLWWGHRIPIWKKRVGADELGDELGRLEFWLGRRDVCVRVGTDEGETVRIKAPEDGVTLALDAEELDLLVCLLDRRAEEEVGGALEGLGLVRDPDVLDTWFSSGIWPHSTLGWPDPPTAEIGEGQSTLGAEPGRENCLDYYYPGSCLVTGRDIITLWVARMLMMGLYNLGDVPFTDVFIHTTILDGKGERMSKSKGNGIDPIDIIERYGCDAMRYVICELQTGTQDIRLPVQAISPFTGNVVDLATAEHGQSIFTYICPESGKEFDVLGTMEGVPPAKLVSERFEVGRAFCNKLLNATRFAMMNLEGVGFAPSALESLEPEDRWILSRLQAAIAGVSEQLAAYNPAAAVATAREFFWADLCDWYLELIKPRMKDEAAAPAAQQVLAHVLDQVLRLFHPFVPFITEFLWQHLNEEAPVRGVDEPMVAAPLLVHAAWPVAEESKREETVEAQVGLLQDVVRVIRDVRAKNNLPMSRKLAVRVRAGAERAAQLRPVAGLLRNIAGLKSVAIGPQQSRTADSAAAVVGDVEIFILGAVDLEKERERLGGQEEQLQKRIAGTERKLANEGFVSKAPEMVVQKERARLEEMRAELAGVEANLAALGE